MQTVITSNNAYDCVLLVDDNDVVVSRWDVDNDVLTSYLHEGSQAGNWHVGEWPSGFAPEDQEDEQVASELRTISAYGREVGPSGRIEDTGRQQFWESRMKAAGQS